MNPGTTERSYLWGNSRRFNSYSSYFVSVYGSRVQKVSIDAGFTCPNRDGTKGTGGCTYCNNKAFNPSYCVPEKPVSMQIKEGIEFHKKRYRKAKSFLAYFQAYTNTYAELSRLVSLYEEALSVPGITGLIIGTRPDCISGDLLSYLSGLKSKYYVMIEYGIESCYDKTLQRINRGHSYSDAVAAVKMTAGMGINTGAHFIFGLPGETRDEMLAEAEIISALPLSSIKFHQLQIIKGTSMEQEYLNDPSAFQLFGWDEYLEFIVRFLEQLDPRIMVERFSGEAPPGYLVKGLWGKKRSDQIISLIESRLQELDTWQGRCYKGLISNSLV